jgi:predicted metal-dependent hydrolase
MDDPERVARRQERERLRRAHPALFAELAEILAEHDPVYLTAIGAPRDEYEPEVGTIIPRLKEASNVIDVRRILVEEFDNWFGVETAKMTPEQFLAVADDVWDAWLRGEPAAGANLTHPPNREELEAHYRSGVTLIRRGEYFAAHEELELAWRAAPQAERDFFQGLVHVAVAWYQAGRGRHVGTVRQLEKAIRRLTHYAPAHRGLDLDSLLTQLQRALQVAQADRLEHAVRIDLHPVELVEEQQ